MACRREHESGAILIRRRRKRQNHDGEGSGAAYSGERKTVITVSALELADIAKQEDGARFARIKNAELLHIDDVGCEPTSVKVWGNEISPLVEVLYHRYDRLLYTVITSNLYEEDILKRYGDRVADRFYEMFDLLSFENKSYRPR